MRRSLVFSVALHSIVVVLTWFGLPHLRRDPPILDAMVFVKLTDVADVTNVPPSSKSIEKELKKIKKVERPKPKPRISTPRLKPTPVKKTPEPRIIKNRKVNPSKSNLIKEVKKKSKVLKPKPRPAPKKANLKPRKSPKPPERPVEKKFTSLLKNLKKEKPLNVQSSKTFSERLKAVSKSQTNRSFDSNQKVTISEIELVRQQISQCWNVTAGARQADSLSVEIEMTMNADATVRQAKVTNSIRMNSDTYYRAAAESALRALSHPDCIPLKLPLKKYELWKSFIFNFDPKSMLQ